MCNKKNCCCLNCTKKFSKIVRHLEQVHYNDEEVKLALSYPKSDKRRKEQFTKIRKMANFNHNMVVLETNKGELKVDRRLTETIDPTQYLPCYHAKSAILFFSRHATTCMSKNGEQKKVSLKQNVTRRTSLAGLQKRDRMQ